MTAWEQYDEYNFIDFLILMFNFTPTDFRKNRTKLKQLESI